MSIQATMTPFTHLPDPEYDAQFYEGVPGKRLAAWIVDALVILLISVLVILPLGVLTLGFGFFLFPALVLTVSFLYRTLTIASRSATWGMRLMGIELRARDGQRLDLVTAAVHTGVFLFLMASIVGWAATVIAILGTRYNQGLPDLLLGTTAINRPL